ncbi:hypothetical protein [Phytohabitans houttuyneae]|uniref:Uncharacterized protein n=1 Tax=Phytohabitans houttuyneae TaxID=1076126 RepID=A0A6V8JXQ7_9ACTN|nr:hypothetical protein [Phytohabitans houttuyneae]GFJ77512.1 hypothetical protein Phou_016920 [Phytohabitans houttuyneae]
MGTQSADEVTIAVLWWRVRQSPGTVLRAVRDTARRNRVNVDGDPVVRVTLGWPRGLAAEAAA